MATIDVRCDVRLPGDIVLATQKDTSYPAIRWQLANRDTVSVEMEVRNQEICHSYQEHASKGNWYVNSRVESLRVSVRLEDVSVDDLDRLYGRHASAHNFVARFNTSSATSIEQPYQEALSFGGRVTREIKEAVNLILRFVRDNYGQHWVRLLSDEEKPIQNFLDEVRAEWREATNPWKRLLVSPIEIVIKGARIGVANLYLETTDWQSIQHAIKYERQPSRRFCALVQCKGTVLPRRPTGCDHPDELGT
jgi:phage-related protein